MLKMMRSVSVACTTALVQPSCSTLYHKCAMILVSASSCKLHDNSSNVETVVLLITTVRPDTLLVPPRMNANVTFSGIIRLSTQSDSVTNSRRFALFLGFFISILKSGTGRAFDG